MVTNCKNCGLPIFHGAAGYAGAQCRCGFSAKPNYDHNALTELLKERDQLRAENADMHEALADSLLDTHTAKLERDTLRKQLDEARELLEKYGYATGDADGRVDAWLKVNK